MIQDCLDELKGSITKAHEALKRELAKIRTGRASANILDSVFVDYYGQRTPLRQVASITVPEARMLAVKPFEKNMIGPVERAILEAQLGLNPANDGELLRIPMPALTEERRKQLQKNARAKGEDCKVAIRKARHEAKDMIDAFQKDGDVGEDEADRGRKSLEEIVKGGQGQVDDIVAQKEKDIMVV